MTQTTVRRLVVWGLGSLMGLGAAASGADPGGAVRRRPLAGGEQLFLKEWVPGLASDRGDGLGPVYNDTSCVACHNLGGIGGAGPASKNVDLITAVVTPLEEEVIPDRLGAANARLRKLRAERAKIRGEEPPRPRTKGEPPDRASLIKLHPGFRDSSSLVLHRFGVVRGYNGWHLAFVNPIFGDAERPSFLERDDSFIVKLDGRPHRGLDDERGHFTLIHAQRNPMALFGVGLIDAIPDDVLEAAERATHPEAPEVSGRVSRLDDGRIGRFGWKAQEATLDDFVLTACAVELGLEVPGHHQGRDPRYAGSGAIGLDLTRDECALLTAYVRSLPAPAERRPATQAEAAYVEEGRTAFARVGCAACHTPRLGPIDGIYGDLLLHDLGDELSDNGLYGGHLTGSIAEASEAAASMPDGPDAFDGAPAIVPPSRLEWRTPPLWGVRDSGPYLHDGRAETLEAAIAQHRGSASRSQSRYFRLSPRERHAVQAFLKSLVAPSGAPPRAEGPDHWREALDRRASHLSLPHRHPADVADRSEGDSHRS